MSSDLNKIRVMIVDDHQMSAYGTKAMLMNAQSIHISSIANSGQEALNFLETEIIDVILLDIYMPEMNGFEVLHKVKEKYPKTKVLMLTISDEKSTILKCLAGDADGLIFKDINQLDLAKAIERTYNGNHAFSNAVFEKIIDLIKGFARNELTKTDDDDEIEYTNKQMDYDSIKASLTEREFEVLKFVGMRLTSAEIARTLNISKFTVNTYRKNLYSKLGTEDHAGILAAAKLILEKES